LATELANPLSDALKPFAKSNEYLEWNKGFSRAVTAKEIASHFLGKQVYFPISNDGGGAGYHLLCNMASSSMAQAFFDGIFSDGAKGNQSFVQKGKFSESVNRSFPKKGKLGVTASNHSNASQLNARRGGKLYLFSTQPSIWGAQTTPPIYDKSFFNTKLRFFVSKDDIDYLREFLLRFEQLNLSFNHPERRKWIDAWVGRIVDDVLAYATSIQDLPAGWSAADGGRLPREHQLFLDPFREDELFQAERKNYDWQSVICMDFARWLNRVLVGKDKKFSPQPEHSRIWGKLMEKPLRERNELIKREVKIERKSV
jgi:CRISPR-associated protein Csy1